MYYVQVCAFADRYFRNKYTGLYGNLFPQQKRNTKKKGETAADFSALLFVIMKKDFKAVPVIAVIAMAVALIFRVFQLLVVVEHDMIGFYSSEAGFFAGDGFYLVLIIFAAALIAGAIYDGKKGNIAYTRTAASLTSKQTAILGAAFLAGACLKFYDLVFGFKGIGLDFFGEALIFAVFAFIGFLILSRKELKPVVGYLQIVICISYTLKAAALFMQDTVIVRVSDELLLLLAYVFAVLFFLALGRFISGIETKLTRYKLMVCGCCAAVLGVTASLAGYIALAIDPVYMGGHMDMHPLSETGIALIAACVVFILYSKDALPEKTTDENENEDENEKNIQPDENGNEGV